MEPLCNRTSFRLRSLLGVAADNEQRLPTRCLCPEFVFAFIARLKIQKALHKATGIAVKDTRHVAQDLVVTAEVAHEFDELAGWCPGRSRHSGRSENGARGTGGCRRARSAHLALLAAEDLDLGTTEAIDRLLRVAHRAQRALARTRQVANQIDLHLVGILELVDHDHLKAVLVGGSDGGMIAQRLVCHAQQIVVIERGLVGLERAVLRLYGTGESRQRIERRVAASQHNVDKRVGSL